MNEHDRLQLGKMIHANNVEDVTNNIRERNHSSKIQADVDTMIQLKSKHASMEESQLYSLLETQCSFLFTYYTDIFNRLKKDELSLEIMSKFIHILHQIEHNEIDQHEGAFLVGKYLKEIYIDSALQRGNKLDMQNLNVDELPVVPLNITWGQYRHHTIQ